MGRLRQAYLLTANEVETVIQALWPDKVFPMELWQRIHAKYWRGFADSNQAVYNIESPALPEIQHTDKYFYPHLCALDIMSFFRKLSLNIQAKILEDGLNHILEETYEDIDGVFPEERKYLFDTLTQLEKQDTSKQYYDASDFFEDKILSLPAAIYHFISHIFSDTVLVDKVAVIRHLRSYPLKCEVKGITNALVNSILNSEPENSFHIADVKAEASTSPEPAVQGGIISIPRALWEHKPETSVRDCMKDEYSDAIIAYVLLKWRKIPKTRIGQLLSKKQFEDDKSYRNLVDRLLQETEQYSIVKAE